MSHFVSKGADFDDLNAKLLQRNTESGEQDDVDELDRALQQANVEQQSGGGDAEGAEESVHGRTTDKLADVPSKDARPPPRPSSIASYFSESLGAKGSRSASPNVRPSNRASTSTTPFTMSRKNSEDELASSTLKRPGNRDRKLSDPDGSFHKAAKAKSPKLATDSTQRHPDAPSTCTDRAVTFSDEPELVQASRSGKADGVVRSNSGVTYLAPPQRHMHPGSQKLQHEAPEHATRDSAQERLANHAAAPARKLGTWDGVFMPVSLNVSRTALSQNSLFRPLVS